MTSTIKTGKYAKSILEDPVPTKSTVAGKSDVNNSSSTVYKHMKKIKDRYNDMPTPYIDFKKDYHFHPFLWLFLVLGKVNVFVGV